MTQSGFTFSVVVPTKNSARTLEACLRSVREQTCPDVELVVVDNYSADVTVEIAQKWADKVIEGGPERSRQRNIGALVGSGEFVCFLDSDLILEPNVLEEAKTLLRAGCARSIVIPELAFGVGFWARCRALEKKIYVGDRTVEAARIFGRTEFLDSGGFDETIIAREDWELADRLEAAGNHLGRTTSFAHHDEGRLSLRTTFVKKRYYGRTSAEYASGSRQSRRREYWRPSLVRRPSLLLRHPLLAAGLGVLKATEALGFGLGRRDARRLSANTLAV